MAYQRAAEHHTNRRDRREEAERAGAGASSRLDPARVLALQRTAGNQATLRHLRAARRGIQRRAYLANSDDLIYKDSNQAPTNGAELAYLGHDGSAGSKRHFFVAYEKLDAVHKKRDEIFTQLQTQNADYFENQVWREKQLQSRLDAMPTPEARDLVGQVWQQGDDGTLTSFTANPVWLKGRIYTLALSGPLYLDVGGGSRLPRAEGTVYVTVPATQADVLTALGVPPSKHADYSQVAVQQVANADAAGHIYTQAVSTGQNVRYLTDVKLNGAEAVLVYVSSAGVARSLRAKFRAADKNYDEAFTGADETTLRNSLNVLAKPVSSGWISGKEIGPEPRGEGQTKAMSGWNALGVAAFAKKFDNQASLDLNQNWEWLHVRAASCGGKTAAGNLVAGPFVANSLMIPYESLIKTWAAADAEHVRFMFEPVDPAPGFARQIRIWLHAQGHKMLGDLAPQALITIDVLTGRVVDRFAGEMIARRVDRRVGVTD